jgi:hypothetical protein
MGFISTANTTSLTAKLTPLGRQLLMSSNNSLITKFALGDSDANYIVTGTLTTGQVPVASGEIGANTSSSNSSAQDLTIKSVILVNNTGATTKNVESQSSTVSIDKISLGSTTVSATSLTQTLINRNDYNTNSLVNLFYSFGLPLDSKQDVVYTGTTYLNGGYSDTALSGIAQTKILTIALNNSSYGEMLDGKEIRLTLPTSAATYTVYTTFQRKGTSLSVEDANYKETSVVTSKIGQNIAILFSDNIKKPNNDSTLSWATGFATSKPFSINQKQLYNLQTNSNLGLTADTAVGVAYLDKGFIVITHPTIVNNYTVSASTGTTLAFNSVSTSVYQNITCIAGRGEFGTSTNTTFSSGDVVRISEVGLYDDSNNLIAIGKTDRHITKNVNDFFALNVKIVV